MAQEPIGIWPKFCQHRIAQGLHVTFTLFGVPVILGALIWAATAFVEMRDAWRDNATEWKAVHKTLETHDRRIESLESWARRP